MKFQPGLRLLSAIGLAWVVHSDTHAATNDPGSAWVSLFDGTSLAGWRVHCLPADRTKEFWSVHDGAIECDSLGRKDHHYVWLVHEAEWNDFELELEFQAFRSSPGNTGVQIRSRYDASPSAPNGGWLDGPQVDIHPPLPHRTGFIYDETRTEKRWIHPSLPSSRMEPPDPPRGFTFRYAEDGEGWNHLRIVARGPAITTVLNGITMAAYDGTGVLDNEGHRRLQVGLRGHIALQLHVHDELKVRFRNVRVRALSAPPATDATVSVNFDQLVVERPHPLIGANIEDLNFQLYGGLYSQLLHGECFEEHVDPTELLSLRGPQRFAVWVLLDQRGQPLLRHFSGRSLMPFYETDGPADWLDATPRGTVETTVNGVTFRGGVRLASELPPDLQRKLVSLATGDAQVSRHWRKVHAGSATGALTLVRDRPLTGKQAQQIRFVSGEGALGIDNAGLFRRGIALAAGKPYEALLRIRSDTAQDVFASLRGADGTILAQERARLEAQPGVYQRITFNLVPAASTAAGRFAFVLKRPGTVTVDFAFLQPGEWGRYGGLPVRRELAEAVIGMGVRTMRYNGSMVNRNPAGAKYYKWKQMIGPRDERPPYHGFFNPYASHGFSVFEFMDFAERAGILPLFGLRTDETEQDLADLVEYCLGGPDTEWGQRRIAHGHPQPYHLRAVQIGNEEQPNSAYLARFKALAGALWSRHRELIVLGSVNVRNLTNPLPAGKKKASRPDEGLAVMVELARWLRDQGQADRFVLDSHYQSAVDHADTALADAMGLKLHERLGRAVPGFSLRLWPMEENGDRCTWERGLAHAHNLNTLHRMPACVERAGAANTFQAWDLALIWDQGRIHHTSDHLVFQPSYHVDRMFADEWLPRVVAATCADPRLDVTARQSRDGRVATISIVNLAATSAAVRLRLEAYAPGRAQVTRIAGERLDLRNTPEQPTAVAPQPIGWQWNPADPRLMLPEYSFTTIRLSP